MKKLLSILLALSMVVGLLAGITLTAAAETVIERIDVTGVTAPAVGSAPATDGFVVGPGEGITYTAQWLVWSYDQERFVPMEDNAVFAAGNVYKLSLCVDLGENTGDEEGIRFDSTLNGESLAPYGAYYDAQDNVVYINKEYPLDVQMIDTIVIESMPAEEAGASTAASAIVLPQDANYVVSWVDWAVVDYMQGIYDNYTEAALEDGKQYELVLVIRPTEGYWFAANPELQAPAEPDGWSFEGNEAYLSFTYNLTPAVNAVEITGVPEAAFGETISVADIQIPQDANYTLDACWYLWTLEEGYVRVDSGTFGVGEYILSMEILPAEGYSIADGVSVTVNGVPVEELDYYLHISDDGILIENWVRLEPENGYIHEFAISGAPEEITAGQDITVPELTVEDGMVTVTDVQWLDGDKAAVTGKFEDNKAYYLAITVAPAEEGYGFESWVNADLYGLSYDSKSNLDSVILYVRYSLRPTVDSISVTVTVPEVGAAPAEPQLEEENAVISSYQWYDYHTGEEVTRFEDGKKYYLSIEFACTEGYDFAEELELTLNGGEPSEYSYDTTSAHIGQMYTFQNIIDRIDVTMPEPAAGQEPDYADIQVSGENYELISARWLDWENWEELTGALGKAKYVLEMEFRAEEGSEFAEDCSVYLNGVKLDEIYVYDDYANVSVQFSFRDVISRVELPAFPEVQVGDAIENGVLAGPEGANYQLDSMWYEYNNGNAEPAEGVFENGKAYYLLLEVIPDTGYEFAQDVTVTVGGKVYTGAMMSASADYVDVMKLYSFGMNVIDKIELNVPDLEDGKPHGEITVPEDAGYTLMVQQWAGSDIDDVNDAMVLEDDDLAAYGNYYWFAAVVMTEEDCVFSDDVQIYINGEAVELDPDYAYVGGNVGQIIHGLGKLTEPVKPGVPNNNDSFPVTPVVLLMILAAAGMAVTVASRKRYF